MKALNYIFLVLFCSSSVFGAAIDWQLGARPQALGSAFVALADDVNACYWNPAGLAELKKTEATFMYRFTGLINFSYLAGALALNERSGLGLAWANLSAQLKEGRPPNEKKSTMSEDVFSLGYGIRLFRAFSVGGNLKRLSVNSKKGGGAGLGFDLGGLYFVRENFSLALVWRNAAADVKNELAPSSFRIGFAGRFLQDKLKACFDLSSKSEVEKRKIQISYHLGIEYQIIKMFSLRLGIERSGFCAGVGIQYNQFKFDYAYLANQIRNNPHTLAVTMQFGKEKKVKTEKLPEKKQEIKTEGEKQKEVEEVMKATEEDLKKQKEKEK